MNLRSIASFLIIFSLTFLIYNFFKKDGTKNISINSKKIDTFLATENPKNNAPSSNYSIDDLVNNLVDNIGSNFNKEEIIKNNEAEITIKISPENKTNFSQENIEDKNDEKEIIENNESNETNENNENTTKETENV
jgi:hypothetical protein